MEKFVDAHCHFDPDAFARYDGAGDFICNAVNVDDWPVLRAAADNDTRIHAAFGLHPWHALGAPDGWADDLLRILAENPHAMVGETGLDASRDNFDAQYDVFVRHYAIAARMKRAVHIHCVHAWDKMLHVLKTMPPPPVIVAHRFSGNENILSAARALSDDIYFSYRDVGSPRVRGVVAKTPLSRILVESDAAAPSPDKIRGVINEIAQIHGKSVSDMADIIYNNSLRVINNGQIA